MLEPVRIAHLSIAVLLLTCEDNETRQLPSYPITNNETINKLVAFASIIIFNDADPYAA